MKKIILLSFFELLGSGFVNSRELHGLGYLALAMLSDLAALASLAFVVEGRSCCKVLLGLGFVALFSVLFFWAVFVAADRFVL